MKAINPIKGYKDYVEIIDQRYLPLELKIEKITHYEEMGEAIYHLAVRGAPLIGIAAAYGFYLGIKDYKGGSKDNFLSHSLTVKEYLASRRPTAVNLFWALNQCMEVLKAELKTQGIEAAQQAVYKEAVRIHEDDRNRCNEIGEYGKSLVSDPATIMTYCNAGALATGGIGTALAPIYRSKEEGKQIKVFVNETRPLLQGARLTAYELSQAGIAVTLICDNTAAYTMKKLGVDIIFVGADRITRNGDTANKIGTYSLAIAAKQHSIPFYVAAPLSTFDKDLEEGDDIPIEERDALEIVEGFGKQTAPKDITVFNAAFDITPHSLITGFITEKGIIYPPFKANIEKWI